MRYGRVEGDSNAFITMVFALRSKLLLQLFAHDLF